MGRDQDKGEDRPGKHDADREGHVHPDTARNIDPHQYGQYDTDDDE